MAGAINRALWLDLETDAWKAGRTTARGGKPPLKSRRDIWNQLTAAEKRETAEAIQEFRFYHESLEGLRVDIPAGRPADLEDLSPGKEYANSIDVFQDALEAARIASEDLVDVRRRCSSARLASTTCSWLRGLIASFVADYNVVTDEIEEFLAVLDAEKRAIGVRLEAAKRAIQANVEAAKRADEAKVEAAKRARKAQWEKAHPLGTPPPSDDGSDTDHDVAVPPPPSAYWVGGFPLAAGGQGKPVVYLMQNQHGIIMDRVCVKDTPWPLIPEGKFEDSSRSNGRNRLVYNPQFFDPDTGGRTTPHQDRQPAEIAALKKLKGHSGVVQLRNWHRINENGTIRSYRTYSEWCGFGDLYYLSRKYYPRTLRLMATDRRKKQHDRDMKKHRARQRGETYESEHDPVEHEDERVLPEDEQDWLPEPFVWSVFESLAKVGLLMHRGTVPQSADNQPNAAGETPFSQIIHMDIKPANVFLGDNTSGLYKRYPQAKLGDFGGCVILPSDKTKEVGAKYYISFGTAHAKAPEQIKLVNNRHALSSKTNVYGLGITMWSLLHSAFDGHYVSEGSEPIYDDRKHPMPFDPMKATFTTPFKKRYSEQLLDLIISCLQYNQDDRPSFEDIMQRISAAVGFWYKKDEGLREAPRTDRRFFGEFALKSNEEKWPVGGTLAKRWPEDHDKPMPPPNKRLKLTEAMDDEDTLGGPGGKRKKGGPDS